jgi:tetratricopeptide (TPR) repeat protein
MRKQITATLAVTALLLFTQSITTAQVQDRAQAAFKAAMDKEVIDGDPKGAIEQYKKIAEGKDRALAAQALLRMADAYRKLGDAQAKQVYTRLIQNYSTQPEAAEARRRVEMMGRRETGADALVSSQVATEQAIGIQGRHWFITPNGRFLSMKFAGGSIVLRDTATGQSQRLEARDAAAAMVSPDGKMVALISSNYDVQLRDYKPGSNL